MNGNAEYPAQLGYAVNSVDGSVRQYTRVKSTEPSGTLSWKNWIEVATKTYVDKVITIPLNDFFTHKSENVEVKRHFLKQYGKVITMYLYFKVNGELPGDGHIFTLKENYRSGYGHAIETMMQAEQPFSDKGSILVSADGRIQIYGYDVGAEYYAYVSWICS